MAWFYLSVSGSVGFVGTQALIRLLLVHWGRLPRRSWEAGFGVLLLGTVVGLGIGWVAAGSLARTAPWVLLLLWCGGHVTFSADALRRDHPTALD